MAPSIDEHDVGAMSDWFENRPTNKVMRLKLAQCIAQRLDMIGIESANSSTGDVKMLDYACGTGFLSRIFAPHVSSITAIDTSQMMIDRYKAKTHELGARHKNTMAIKGDLFSEPPEPLVLAQDKYHNFSLITVGAALHHFPDTEHAVQCLARRIRPGGVLCVEDIFDNGHRQQEKKQPRGFTLDELRSVMSGAGLVDFRFEVLPNEFEIELPGDELVKMKCFIARAMKPVTN